VYFPVFEAGMAISDKKYYTERSGRVGIPGDVVEIDKGADLALVRVDRPPEGATEISLGTSPDPGQTVHSGAVDAQSLSTFVDITEVKRLMNRRSVQALRTVAATEPQKKDEPKKDPPRDKALASKDAAKFFGEETIKKVGTSAELLFKEKKLDFMVETFAVPPKSDTAKVAAMSAVDREKFFREIAEARAKAEKVHGLYILVCKSPGFVYVVTSNDADLPADLGSKLRSQLIASFKEKKFDEGLTKATEMVLEAKGLGEKK
jgi:hypothetical protein